ncbi:MAG: hypothetical protein ACI4QR_00215 [Eubacteriales bacterium]
MRGVVTKYAGPVRTPRGIAKGQKIIDTLVDEAQDCNFETESGFCYYNMISCAKMILDGAAARKESIGAHYVVEDLTNDEM